MLKLFPAALALLLAAGCATALNFTEAASGTTVTVRRGASFTVTLPGNPTTGYVWDLVGCDPNRLQVARNEFLAPETPLCGAPGRHVYEFTALKPGRCEIRAVYLRPWEKGVKPAQTFRLNVDIHN